MPRSSYLWKNRNTTNISRSNTASVVGGSISNRLTRWAETGEQVSTRGDSCFKDSKLLGTVTNLDNLGKQAQITGDPRPSASFTPWMIIQSYHAGFSGMALNKVCIPSKKKKKSAFPFLRFPPIAIAEIEKKYKHWGDIFGKVPWVNYLSSPSTSSLH